MTQPRYLFTGPDMTSGFRNLALHLFDRFKARPCRYLEVGVWQGASGCFMLDEILTHPSADYTGIDPYEGEYAAQYLIAIDNLYKDRGPNKVRLLRGSSSSILPALAVRDEVFDMVYIDGCHSFAQCYSDITLAWPLLSKGGVMLVDDYNREDYGVKQAVRKFLWDTPDDRYTEIYRDYQIAWGKV